LTWISRYFVAAVIFAALLSGTATAKAHRSRSIKARTHFLATGACIRGTWGLNQDIYLAEITLKKEREVQLVRLIDEYTPFAQPLSVTALTAAAGTVLRVRRDEQCNIPYRQMHLRTAPGDPMAILQERLSYRPQLQTTPGQDDLLPRYRTVRP
jgi:hypothetical protein